MQRPWKLALTAVVASLVGLVAPAAAYASPHRGSFDTSNAGVTPGQVATSAPAPGTSVHSQAYADPGVLTFGDARYYGAPTSGPGLSAPVVGMAATKDGRGYWLTAADGGIFSYGDAAFHGSAGDINLNAPVVGMTASPDGGGYWQVALDGGIFTYGDANFYGSTGNIRLNQPIVGMAATPDGRGYWLVASDGGIFAFGDAGFYGSTGNIKLNSPITGMAPTKDGRGYWLVAADGGIFSFGDARFYGSLGADTNLPAGIVGMAPTPDGKGYLLVGNGGGVYAFGDAVYRGQSSAIQPTEVITGIATTPDGLGYWLLEPDAFPVAFNHPGPTSALEARIVSIATSQVHGNPDYKRSFCNPYGPCEEWCALFATWVWDTAGIPIPRYAFVGNVFDWAAAHTGVFGAKVKAQPGDFVLYGTGPQTVATAVHMAVVTQVWPDGAIDTVDGDSGPAPYGHFNVTLNGPFLPSNSAVYNGFPIFAFARP